MKIHTLRITPGKDLKIEIEKYAAEHDLKAAFIVTCVGGLNNVTLRMAGAQPNKQDIRAYEGDYGIVSLVGTVATNGSHLHIAVSDSEGRVMGGHLKEGTIVSPAAEIILSEPEDVTYIRKLDEQTGFEELSIA